MSIKYRLLGAFLLILCLTTGVAAVGWLGLGSYARRVDVASAGQNVETLINALALAAERAVASGDLEKLTLQEPIGRVGEAIETLRHSARDDGDAINRVQASIETFKRDLADYSAQEHERAVLVASRFALINQFEAIATEIAVAQGEALHAAADTAKIGRATLISAATAEQLLPFLGDALGAMREAAQRFSFTNRPDDQKTISTALGKLQMMANGVAHRPGAEAAAPDLLSAIAASREALKDPDAAKAELPALFATMSKAVQAIKAGFSDKLAAAITQYEDQEFKLAAATAFREAALQVDALAIRARSAEQALVINHDTSAAKTIMDIAGAIEKSSQDLVYRVTQPATEQKIRALIAQIGDYKQGLNRLITAQEKQATLLHEVNAATTAAVRDAKSLTNAQLGAMEHEHRRADLLLGLGVLIALVMGLALALVIGRSITQPLQALADVMGRLAKGDKSVEIPGRHRRDELREVAAAVVVFRDNALAMERMTKERAAAEEQSELEKHQAVLTLANDLDRIVSSVVDSIGTAAHGLQATASSLTSTAADTHQQAAAAASASDLARTNVQAVAAAAEQLSASISEISRQAGTSTDVAARAVKDSNQMNARVVELTLAAEKIETVVSLIQQIANQTNLLALNATIEAARAGPAGAGFAVVASEVKSLAKQTATATAEIAVQISAIQQATRESVNAIGDITRTIGKMEAITAAISVAVEQQGQATNAIARNIQEASTGTADASTNITNVSGAARKTGVAADTVLSAASALARDSDHLRGQVRQFLQQVVNGRS